GARRPAHCVNYVGHLDGLCAELSARENLAFVSALAARPLAPEHLTQALASVAAQGYAEQPLRSLSSGQRRRVALARLVLLDAPLWLLDEPFTALDRANRSRVEALLDAHLNAGGSVVIATHQGFAGPHPTQVITLEDYA
ncbi:MAG: ATP-binding cassette domain-containing protein, partial [Alphaproteobacteria bacterium]|nr:ATP-binding cassette domain-containing protein [Alphaproteobacteria bacterium]